MEDRQALAAQDVRWIEALALPPGSRVLVVGEPGPERAVGQAVVGFGDPLGPTLPAGAFAAALVKDALERTEWDRWLLRRLRATLTDGAPVRIRARNLSSLASPHDVLALAARAGREFARRIATGRVAAGRAAGAHPDRRLTPARLRALLQPTGYDVTSVRGAPFGARWTVEARARVPDPITGTVPCGGCDAAVAAYARAHAAELAARERWVESHREAAPVRPPRVFDAAAYAGRTVLLLAPHPDDEVIGCGGTALLLVRAGARVVCVQATDGSDSRALRDAPTAARHTVRVAEARAVAQAAGFAEVEFWGADDAAFRSTPALVARLADRIARERPALVFTPFLTDQHRDHVAMSAILGEALERQDAAQATADCEVLGYEVWGAAPPDVVCDVTDLRAEHEALLGLYETGMKVDDFVELCTRRGFAHACLHLGRPGLAETFFACPAREFPALARAADRHPPHDPSYQAAPTASV